MRTRNRLIGILALPLLVIATPGVAQTTSQTPAHPDQIEFPPLTFDPPQAADYRRTIGTSAGEVCKKVNDIDIFSFSGWFIGAALVVPPTSAGPSYYSRETGGAGALPAGARFRPVVPALPDVPSTA